ncbi:MAG: hypothetical protein E6G07_00715 [Actinobacteria bacterium]|nr:MAG: hypothetical protein E6G53_01600 [Actinomycetota bacterium]TML83835.1 MAG: hypothetical protein E6G07_00715 [Actinomycetota bacterium]
MAQVLWHRARLAVVATLAGAALLISAATHDRGPATRVDLQVPRPSSIVAPARAARPILRPAHFLDGPSAPPQRRWAARAHIRR